MTLNNEVMRVLMLSWEYPPHIEGGLGRHVAELAPALVQQGVEVHIVTPADGPISYTLRDGLDWTSSGHGVSVLAGQATVITEDNGVIVHRVDTSVLQATDIYNRVIEVNNRIAAYVQGITHNHDHWHLIHTHDWLTGPAAQILQEQLGYPMVATIHATERGRARGHLANPLQWSIDGAERELIYRADRVIVCSYHMLDELQEYFQAPAKKLDVVPNGVNVDVLHHLADGGDLTEFRAKYAVPNEQIVFTVSRLVYEKGVHRLIDATPQILSGCPNVRVIVAGRGPEADNLKQQAHHLGVAERVNFIGFVSDQERDRLFKVADCAVFPSLYEPFGIVALEAMALDCPVVVSDVGGLSEVVTHKRTGITVFPDDPESVAWGVVRSLTKPEWTERHVARARRWVEEYFNWPRIASLTIDVYHHVLDGSKKPVH